MAGYIGSIPVPQATQTREAFTATSNQTTFNTGGYTAGFIDVFMNGVKLAAADFTATNGSDVVLASGAAADDIVEVVAYTAFEVLNQNFTGTTTVAALTATGAISGTSADFDGGVTIDNITIDGAEIDLSAGDLLLDVAGDIILDADGGDISFKDGGTEIGRFINDSSSLQIRSTVNNKDIVLAGLDDNSTINALTLDMSAAGAATFNSSVDVTGTLTADVVSQTNGAGTITLKDLGGSSSEIEASGTLHIDFQGSNFEINTNDTARFNISSGGDISFYEDTGTTPKFFWDASAESLGLGTTSPTADIHMTKTGSSDFSEIIFDSNRSGSNELLGRLRWYWNGTEVSKIDGLAGSDTTNKDDGILRFLTRPSGSALAEAMRIDSNGNVGIGSSPTSLLHLESDTPVITLRDTSAYSAGTGPYIQFQGIDSGSTNRVFGQIYGLSNGSNSGELAFYTRNSGSTAEAMRISSAGNVGIGTSSPTFAAGGGVHLVNSNFTSFRATSGSNTGVDFAQFTDGIGYVYNRDNAALIFGTNNTERMRLDSSGKVYIGTSTDSGNLLTIYGSDAAAIFQSSTTGTGSSNGFTTGNNGTVNSFVWNYENGFMQFGTNNAERMRIDSSGNLLVGTTNSNPTGNHEPGTLIAEYGQINVHRDGGNPLRVGSSVDGNLTEYYKQGALVGSIGFVSTGAYIQGETNHSGFRLGGSQIVPFRNGADTDNTTDLGASGTRFDDIFATNGTIQTSDANEKQDIEALSDAEKRVATAAKSLIKKFRWKDKVTEKGDDARIHVGIVAQDLKAAFEAEGLDAGRYAMFISTTWTDDDGNEQTRLGVRYNELLAFIIGAM